MALNRGGTVLTGDALVEHAKRNGLCVKCGVTQTHDRSNNFLSRKLIPKDEVYDEAGNLVIYKGYCVQPQCFSLQAIKAQLGENTHRKRGTDFDGSMASAATMTSFSPHQSEGSTHYTASLDGSTSTYTSGPSVDTSNASSQHSDFASRRAQHHHQSHSNNHHHSNISDGIRSSRGTQSHGRPEVASTRRAQQQMRARRDNSPYRSNTSHHWSNHSGAASAVSNNNNRSSNTSTTSGIHQSRMENSSHQIDASPAARIANESRSDPIRGSNMYQDDESIMDSTVSTPCNTIDEDMHASAPSIMYNEFQESRLDVSLTINESSDEGLTVGVNTLSNESLFRRGGLQERQHASRQVLNGSAPASMTSRQRQDFNTSNTHCSPTNLRTARQLNASDMSRAACQRTSCGLSTGSPSEADLSIRSGREVINATAAAIVANLGDEHHTLLGDSTITALENMRGARGETLLDKINKNTDAASLEAKDEVMHTLSLKAVASMREAVHYKDYTEFFSQLERNGHRQEAVIVGLRMLCKAIPEAHDQDSRVASMFASGTWVKSLKSAMSANSGVEEIQDLGAVVFAVLCSTSRRYLLDLVKYGGVATILSILKNSMNAQTVDSCCCAIFCMVDTRFKEGDDIPRNVGLLMSNKLADSVVDDLICAMEIASSEGKSWALNSLMNLSMQKLPSPDGRPLLSYIRDNQGIGFIVDAMKSDASHLALARSALGLLCRFSTIDDIQLSSAELVTAVFFVIAYVSDDVVHELGFTLFGNLVFTPSIISSVNMNPLIDSLASSMSTHRSNPKLQLAAMTTVSRILHLPEQREQASELDSLISITIEIMDAYLDDVELQSSGCLALSAIAACNEGCKICIVGHGGVSAVSRAIKRHLIDVPCRLTIHDELRLHACTIYASLAASAASSSALREEETISTFSRCIPAGSAEIPDCIRLGILSVMLTETKEKEDQTKASGNSAIGALLDSRSCTDTESAMALVANLCADFSTVLIYLIASASGNGIGLVGELMLKYSTSLPVQEAGCDILFQVFSMFPVQGRPGVPSLLEVDSKNVSVVLHPAEAIDATTKAFSMFKDTPALCVKATGVLIEFLSAYQMLTDIDFSGNDHIRQLFAGSLKDCVDALSMHQEDFEVQSNCLLLVRCLLLLDDEYELRQAGALVCECVVSVLELHFENMELAVDACWTLFSLIIADEDFVLDVVIGGSDFVNLMLKCVCTDVEDLIEAASRVLATAVPKVMFLSGELANSQDSFEVFINCLYRCPGSTSIATNCCLILAVLAEMHDPIVKAIIAHSGGVPAILEAMKRHSSNNDVQEAAFKALVALCEGIPHDMFLEMRSLIGDVVVQALATNRDNPSISYTVFQLLCQLCRQDTYFKQFFGKHNAAAEIVETMKAHIPEAKLQGCGCEALWRIFSLEDNMMLAVKCDCHKAVINALLAHIDTYSVQKDGLIALKHLATTSQLKQSIKVYDGEDAIQLSMRCNPNSEELLSAAFAALNNLAVDTETCTVSQASREIFDCILIGMRKFPKSQPVQRNGCFLMKTYSFAPSNVDIIRSRQQEFIEGLDSAGRHFPDECGDRVDFIMDRLFR